MHTRYLEEDLEGDELLVAFLEEDSKDAALPHLVQDADAHRGGSDGQQHQQKADFVMLFTAEWGQMLWQQLEGTWVSFSVASVLEREASLLRNGVTRH